MGLGKHSETDEELVIYEPLYDASGSWLGDLDYAVRPLYMWQEDVEWNGKVVKRFTLIDDTDVR
ncbi:MAG: DUF1653 domain-containing protein [Candidatus Peribacteria bacterium]|nr:MAG: DUF1653 domain-containing protein [Candidatus Peribacteria bacterium]